MILYHFLRFFFSCYLPLVHRLTIRGRGRMPVDGAVIIFANHTSYLDAMLLALCTPRPVRFMVSRNFYDHPILGFIIRRSGGIPVSPNGIDPQAFKQALRVLKGGEVIGIFPEGRLSRTGLPSSGRPGALLLAALSGAPVVPVTITGAFFVYPRGELFPRPGAIRVTIHFPLSIDRERSKERQYLQELTDRIMAGMGKRLRGYYRVRGRRRRGAVRQSGSSVVLGRSNNSTVSVSSFL